MVSHYPLTNFFQKFIKNSFFTKKINNKMVNCDTIEKGYYSRILVNCDTIEKGYEKRILVSLSLKKKPSWYPFL